MGVSVERGRTFGPRKLAEVGTFLEAWSLDNGRLCAACGPGSGAVAWRSGLCGPCWVNDTHPGVRALLKGRGLPAPGIDDDEPPRAARRRRG